MIACYPKLLDETIVKEHDGKFLFLIPSKPDWIVTNRNGAAALSLCDGKHTFEDIRVLLAEHPNSDEAVRLIETLHNDGFFENRPHDTPSFALQLRSVHLNISPHCNLNCNYCYAEERQKDIGNSLSLNEYRLLIDSLVDINNRIEIAITGGEPLLNRDASEISSYCRSKGFYTHLLTNATTIDEKNVETIVSSFNEIRISIDGCTPEKHDYHRGIGSFKKTTNAIALLEKSGANIRLAMTVTKNNIDEIQQMAECYGNRLIFQPLFETGSAKHRGLGITGEEYFYALKTAKGVEPYSQIGQTLLRLKNRGTTKCAIGDAEISISHNGDVYPCHMLHLPDYLAGNIRERTILDIYTNSKLLEHVRALNVNTRDNCKECPIRLLCGGTCRARALFQSGNLDVADNFCDYEFLAFTEGLLNSVELTSLDTNNCSSCECGNLHF